MARPLPCYPPISSESLAPAACSNPDIFRVDPYSDTDGQIAAQMVCKLLNYTKRFYLQVEPYET